MLQLSVYEKQLQDQLPSSNPALRCRRTRPGENSLILSAYWTYILESFVCIALAKELIYTQIQEVSRDFGVSHELMDYIVRNESGYQNCAVGDYHVPKPSYGLVQINLYYHPYVRLQDAHSSLFALEFLASNLREGKCRLWTTCRRYYSTPNNESWRGNNHDYSTDWGR